MEVLSKARHLSHDCAAGSVVLASAWKGVKMKFGDASIVRSSCYCPVLKELRMETATVTGPNAPTILGGNCWSDSNSILFSGT